MPAPVQAELEAAPARNRSKSGGQSKKPASLGNAQDTSLLVVLKPNSHAGAGQGQLTAGQKGIPGVKGRGTKRKRKVSSRSEER